MKVERNSSSRPVRSVARAAYARRIDATGSLESADAAQSSASVLGIPESEFTPKVRDAIMGLMNEVENLRRELSQTKARLDEMEKTADQTDLADDLAPGLATNRVGDYADGVLRLDEAK